MSIIPCKVCSACKEHKPLTEFYFHKDKPLSACKVCLRQRRVSRYVKHPRNPDVLVNEKRCPHCDQVKPFDSFRPDVKQGRLRSWCRACEGERVVAWKRAHRKPRKVRVFWVRRGRRQDYDPIGFAARKRKNFIDFARRHPDKIKQWRLVSAHRRRARVAASGGKFTQKEWRALRSMYGNKCLCCGSTDRLTIDHVVPIVKGGRNTIDNIQPLCWKCNNFKRARTIDYRNPPFSRVDLEAFLT